MQFTQEILQCRKKKEGRIGLKIMGTKGKWHNSITKKEMLGFMNSVNKMAIKL